MTTRMLHVMAIAVLLGLACAPARAELVLADHGRSDYVIYFDHTAHAPLRAAAVELQTYLAKATGATLPIVEAPAAKMICLGDNAAARAAGIALPSDADDALRVVVRGQSLYLLGRDTPPGQTNATGGVSTGTAFAVYVFLERALGVRWLLPGPDGEDVPGTPMLRVADVDWTEQPALVSRALQGIHDKRLEVQDWKRRNRLGVALAIGTGHAWDDYPPRQVLLENPQYMALVGGVRVKPDKHPTHNMFTFKFCTTDPGLLDAVAAGVEAKWSKGRYSMSLSPSDGDGWCECETCSALVIRQPSPRWGDYGGYGQSNTKRVIQFYNDVARRLAANHPNTMLGGLVYASYTYPPDEPVAVEPNVFLCLAPRPYYGFTLYKPQYRQQFVQLISAWTQITPNVGYMDYCTWLRDYVGAPLPPAKSILQLVFTTLPQYGVRWVYLCGQEAWGYGGLHNYLAARLMWNPQLDVEAEYRDFLARAYGPGAHAMDRFYTLLDQRMADYEIASSDFNYEITTDLVLQVYLPILPQLESLYQEAAAKDLTPPQRARLHMMRDNLRILHRELRVAGVIKDFEQSPFYLSDEEYRQFRVATRGSLALAQYDDNDEARHGGLTHLSIAENRRVVVPRLAAGAAAPALDGRLDDQAWAGAAVLDNFRIKGALDRPAHPTSARLVFDEQNLYLAVICEGREGDQVVANISGADDQDKIYSDDVVEIFLTPTADPRNHWWHLTANANAARWDGLLDRPAYNLNWTAAAAIDGSTWTLEIAIPFKELGLTQAPAGQTWRANLMRENPPVGEHSTWNKVEQRFAEPENFGSWYFVKPGEVADTF